MRAEEANSESDFGSTDKPIPAETAIYNEARSSYELSVRGERWKVRSKSMTSINNIGAEDSESSTIRSSASSERLMLFPLKRFLCGATITSGSWWVIRVSMPELSGTMSRGMKQKS